MADLNAALVEQFLDIPVTQGKTVVQPNGVLDNGHRKAAKRRQRRCFGQEAVAVRSRVGHGGSAYPSPIKATQPCTVRLVLAQMNPGVPDSLTRNRLDDVVPLPFLGTDRQASLIAVVVFCPTELTF